MDFDYNSYECLIRKIKEANYHICNYSNYSDYEYSVILRHDVDMSLEKALEMAKLENRLNVKSTYFILLTSDFYNISSLKNAVIINQIHNLGHDIGLHFDEVRYGEMDNIAQIKSKIEYEIFMMEQILGQKIKVVSMHRPSKKILESNLQIGGDVINSYSHEFFKEFKYVSDSRRLWRENVDELIDSHYSRHFHILTHPIWYGNESEDMKKVLERFLRLGVTERYAGLKENIRDFEQVISSDEVEKMLK